jgi:carboxynorspermidine decarboxylase
MNTKLTDVTETKINKIFSERLDQIESPAYVLDEVRIRQNLDVFQRVMNESGAKAILALKAFSSFSVFPLLRSVLSGTTSSSLHEAQLAHEEFGKDIHVYSPAYRDSEFESIQKLAHSITFNSFSQWQHFQPQVNSGKYKVSYGIRLNPEHSETRVQMYDPCQPFSRLGVTIDEFRPDLLDGISGFHIHTLCAQSAEALERTLKVAEEKFGQYFHQVSWLNFGGGHMLTRDDYNVDKLIEVINYFQDKYKLQVIIEPGEAVVLRAGYFVATVVDLLKNKKDIAILDTSANAHMPDIIEMPYRPNIQGSAQAEEFKYTYRLGGITCLSGDIIGDYSFNQPLKIGQKLIFEDMAQYTMVKNTTFNGLRLPSIYVLRENGNLELIKHFGYSDFKSRLS